MGRCARATWARRVQCVRPKIIKPHGEFATRTSDGGFSLHIQYTKRIVLEEVVALEPAPIAPEHSENGSAP